jgi:hypothetical protein
MAILQGTAIHVNTGSNPILSHERYTYRHRARWRLPQGLIQLPIVAMEVPRGVPVLP